MAKRLYNHENTPKTQHGTASTRIPILKIAADVWTPQERPTDLKPSVGSFYSAQLLRIVEQKDWYRWQWLIYRGSCGEMTPTWRIECVTDCQYVQRRSLKLHLDTLLGEERTMEEWRAVGLGKLVGRKYNVLLKDDLHQIVPYQGYFWKTGEEIITHERGIYVASAEMLQADRKLFGTWLTATVPPIKEERQAPDLWLE